MPVLGNSKSRKPKDRLTDAEFRLLSVLSDPKMVIGTEGHSCRWPMVWLVPQRSIPKWRRHDGPIDVMKIDWSDFTVFKTFEKLQVKQCFKQIERPQCEVESLDPYEDRWGTEGVYLLGDGWDRSYYDCGVYLYRLTKHARTLLEERWARKLKMDRSRV